MKHTSHRKTCLWTLILCGFGAAAVSAVASPSIVERTIEERVESEEHNFKIVQVIEGLEHPWAVTWLTDNKLIVGERAGRMHLVVGESITEISGLPEIAADEEQQTPPTGGGQGGLLDIVAHPDYARNGWIYFTFSNPGDDDSVVGDHEKGTGTALARARLSDDQTELVDLKILYVQQPLSAPGRHYGSRIVFPGNGMVIFSIGDNGLRYTSQDLTHPAGSMIRLHEDGRIPRNNPFVGMQPGNLRPEIYSFGHRNNQGMAIHPQTNEIWTTDHGPYGGDILYRVERGRNYGWPQVSYGREYSTKTPIGLQRQAPGVTPAVHIWEDSKAPSGLVVYDGAAFPAWRGHLFAGFLLDESVSRLVVQGDRVRHEERLLHETIGRIRDVRQGPDGYLYILTDKGDGGLYRIEPID